MAPPKNDKGPCHESTPRAVNKILKLLKDKKSLEDTKALWTYLKSMGDDKGLIKFLGKNDITRMWEIAVGTDTDIAVLMARNDAAAAVKAVLPGKWIVKSGEIKGGIDDHTLSSVKMNGGGWGSFRWAPNSNGFPFEEDFEMTISNDYSVHFGDIGGEKSKAHVVHIEKPIFSVELKVDHVPDAVKHCVAAFTFGDGSNTVANQIKVYIRFAGPTMLVGKAFKANWANESKDKKLWGDLVFAKH